MLATIGLYTVLYRENKFYRFWEHVFLGLASGWALVILWTESLYSPWWLKMVGTTTEAGQPATMGYWPYVLLLPIGLMGYLVFHPKHNWISRIPIGVILGLYSGQQFSAWQTRYLPQIQNSIKPIVPTGTFLKTAQTAPGTLTWSQALTNLIFVVTVLSVLSYFLFSIDVKNRLLKNSTTLGRWLLMIGFGAIFGSTVMMRFTLLIDRMFFVWIEFVKNGLFGHG
ncbi:hypothetical protein [Fimbriimonas ginsengisoli]|uniref:hypothetical protein n=1 Tax=Fimbriimonas ginsengisoli TaxID=1005039 RepID=UPI0011853FA4|nr:hypothetical protein [Fimbriimonas ginsengisoli]